MTAVPALRLLEARPAWWRAAAVAGGAVVMALASQLEWQAGPVPVTAQTFALFVLAGLFGGAITLGAVLLWLAAAAAGLPVLAGGASGWMALLGYTAGFLAGMAGAAWIVGRAAERARGFWTLLALFLAGHLIVLFLGFVGLLSALSVKYAFLDGVAPFVPGALLKSLAAAAVVRLAAR
jgi:biotin transport system substrate-specific component